MVRRWRLGAWLLGSATALTLVLLSVPGSDVSSSYGENDHRPNLRISQGSIRIRQDRLTGSFIVVDAGDGPAAASTARIRVHVDGRDRLLATYRLPALVIGGARRLELDVPIPQGRQQGRAPVEVCADVRHEVGETSETDNCHRMGSVAVAHIDRPSSRAPNAPISYTPDKVFTLGDHVDGKKSNYWIVVPKAYDASNRTPTSLLVWLHGCQTGSKYEINTASPAARDGTPTQRWISIAPGGREYSSHDDGCWNPDKDQAKVFAAIRNVESHFNIDPHRIVLGGFSSGGDLAYRMMFDHSRMFAGLLAEGTLPFRDTGKTQSELLREAGYKFPIVHVAHLQDDQYPIGEVRREIRVLQNAGYPVKYVERPGEHSEPDMGDTGTGHDADVYLIPHMYDGWRSP